MQLIDLSRDIHHMMQRLPNHSSIMVTTYGTHDEVREAEGVKFSSASLALEAAQRAGCEVAGQLVAASAGGGDDSRAGRLSGLRCRDDGPRSRFLRSPESGLGVR